MTLPATSFAVLTPPGTAAVATVAIVGPRSWDIARTLFRSAGGRILPAAPVAGRLWYGQFGSPPGDAVILAVRAIAPNPIIEVHCHGGVEVGRLVTAELGYQGIGRTDGYEHLRASGLSAIEARAQAALGHAPTLRTAATLLDQVNGAFRRAVNDVADAVAKGDTATASHLVVNLARHAPLGRHLTRPWRVVITGATNVGKSSLINAIAGFRRSVVTPTPGTTRDAVILETAIDGWPVEFVDTAGRRETADGLEAEGIARAHAQSERADLVLWLVSQSEEPVWPDPEPPAWFVVVNKLDLPATWNLSSVPHAISVSALTRAGLPALLDHISERLVPDPPPPGAAVPFTADLADIVAMAADVARTDPGALRAAVEPLVRLVAPEQSR